MLIVTIVSLVLLYKRTFALDFTKMDKSLSDLDGRKTPVTGTALEFLNTSQG